MAPRRKANGREFSTSPKSEAMRFAFNAAAHAYRKHPRTSRVPLQNSEESPGRSRLSAARLPAEIDMQLHHLLFFSPTKKIISFTIIFSGGEMRGRKSAA